MNKTDIAAAVYETHTEAEAAVKTLQRAGFEMKKISIIGRNCSAAPVWNHSTRSRFSLERAH
jgi:hypothetical protein